MKLVVTVQGDMRKIMSQKVDDAKLAVTTGVARTGKGLKSAWRGAVAGALGSRMGNAIREKTYPEGRTSLRAASMVYAQPAKIGAGAAGIVEAFDKGATITAKNVRWLAVPLEAAGKGRGGSRPTPGEWQFKTGRLLKFVPMRSGFLRAGNAYGMLVAEGVRFGAGKSNSGTAMAKRGKRRKDGILTGETTIPIFLLVRQVKLPKKFDLASEVARAQATLAGNIIAAWPKEKA